MRRLIRGVVGLAVLLAGAFLALHLRAVQDRLVLEAIRKNVDSRPTEALFEDDALRLLVVGSASPLPSPDRARACIAVIAGGRFYLVDVGPGSVNRLGLLRVPGQRIGGVLITHHHSDHIGDLGEINFQSWAQGRPGPLQVYGPAGIERVVAGFTEAYALDSGYRIAHHGSKMFTLDSGRMQPHVLALSADGSPTPAFSEGELKVTVFPVSHQPIVPAVGYRFDYKGRAVVITGDTRKDDNIARVARGADVLAHEAQNQEMVATMSQVAGEFQRPVLEQIFKDIRSYHTSPVEAAQIANAAQVPLLLLYHLTPPPPNRIAERVFVRGVAEVRKDGVVLARDGTLIELPLDSREVRVRELH